MWVDIFWRFRKKKKIFRKLLLIGVIAIMALGVFTGCERRPEFVTDQVWVSINAEFRDKFLAEEFTVEDFEWDNVERMVYNIWYDSLSVGCMTVYLKEHGRRQVLNAVEHFNTLKFVREATVIAYVYAWQ